MKRVQALDEARLWLGTPYRHQMSARGAGCDCLGLVRGVWRALYGEEPEHPPPYTPDWDARGPEEALLEAARRHLVPVSLDQKAPGDVLVFRYRSDCRARHCAILSAPDRMVHAWQGQSVCETALGPWWRRRIAGVFGFPDTLGAR